VFLAEAVQQVKRWEDARWQGYLPVIPWTQSGQDDYFLAAHVAPRSIDVLYARSGDKPIPGEAHEARNISVSGSAVFGLKFVYCLGGKQGILLSVAER
jgi:hypothetical protein